MRDKVFLDSNLLVYTASSDVLKKQTVQFLLQKDFDFVVSTQVLSEFSNVCYKKNLLPPAELEKIVRGFCAFFQVALVEPQTIFSDYSIKARLGFSFYDSMIIAAAIGSGCALLFSEDLQHNQFIENSLKIQNPFVR